MKWVVTVLALVLGAQAQTKSCPVAVKAGYWMGCIGHKRCIEMNLQNETPKKIVGVKVSVIYLDAVGDPHGSFFDYTSDDKTAPVKGTATSGT
jgi:hypothetical protein